MNRQHRHRIMAVLVSVLLALVCVEVALQVSRWWRAKTPGHVLCGSCGVIYRLNARHDDVSSQSLRDREFAASAPPGATRILVLGDSMAFGMGVRTADTYPKILEENLRRGNAGRYEVINAGVNGYSPYNELHYYLEDGHRFGARVVIVGFCMNDVVDPALHWQYTGGFIENIPEAAIPNPEYHRTHVLSRLAVLKRDKAHPINQLRRLSATASLLVPLRSSLPSSDESPEGFTTVNGRRWPVFLTTEDTLSIHVLRNYDSPEWQWLRRMYDQLDVAVRGNGGRMVVVFFPLAYQLDDAYPFSPEPLLMRYCAERSIPCLDLLPALRRHRSEKLYRSQETVSGEDVWHLAPQGHRRAAEELRNFLIAHGIIHG